MDIYFEDLIQEQIAQQQTDDINLLVCKYT